MATSDPNKRLISRADLHAALDAVQTAAHRLALAIERNSPKAPIESSISERSPSEAPPLNAALEDTSIVPSAGLLPLFAHAEVEVAATLERPTQSVPTTEANNEARPRPEENSGFAERLVDFKDRRGGSGFDALPLNAANEATTIVPSADLLPLFAYAEVEGVANPKRSTQESFHTAKKMTSEDQPQSDENIGFAARLVELKNRRGGFGPG